MSGRLAMPAAAALCLVLLSACSATQRFEPLPPPTGEAPLASVLLIGDAGAAKADAPVLASLRTHAGNAAERATTVVAFLGDNVYPAGLRSGESDFSADTLMLGRQVDAVAGTGARAVFLPGNHDWDNSGPDAVNALTRQADFLASRSGPEVDASLIPAGACPGPEILDLPGVRLLLLDTQWFIHDHERGCSDRAPTEVASEITRAIDGAGGRPVLVLSHHPMRTHGTHGGFFTARSHLFPLADFVSWAYLPLPVLGTGYVLLRQNGFTDQDLSGGGNQRMRALLEEAFRAAARPPLLHAAGHEHSLEVLRGESDGPALYLVSGAGSKSTAVGRGDDTILAAEVPGFMQVDVYADHLRLSVVAVDGAAPAGADPVSTRGWCRVLEFDDRSLSGC